MLFEKKQQPHFFSRKAANQYSSVDGGSYTFVQVQAGLDDELTVAESWLQQYAARYGGRVFTNFDQIRPFLSDAPLSYQRLVNRTYDRVVIENLYYHGGGSKLADRIDHVESAMAVTVTLGNGTVVQGDLVVANSIKESFNRASHDTADKQLSDTLQRVATELGRVLEKLDPETARKAADDLDTLTKEAARPQPRRKWWELSIEGIKEAAESVKEIGVPVLETVKMLVPLLTAASS